MGSWGKALRLTFVAAALFGVAATAVAGPDDPPSVAGAGPVNPLPATPFGPLPPSATEPPSGRAVELVPSTIAVPDTAALTVRAGIAVRDASWRIGASAGQYAGDPFLDGDLADIHPDDPHLLSLRRVASYGLQSRMSTRALVIEGGDGTRMALVSNDLYIPQDLVNQRVATILEEHDRLVQLGQLDEPLVGINHTNLAVSVSHSHSSPYYSSLAWGPWLFQDVFDLRFFEYLAQHMAGAVLDAVYQMLPVRMGATRVPFDHTQRHSFGTARADDGSPAGYPERDNDLGIDVLRFDDLTDPTHPRPYAVYATLGQHPEMLEGNNLISGEWVQMALRMIEAAQPGLTPMLVQNNTGTSEPDRNATSHSPAVRAEYSHREYAQVERAARQVANAVLTGMNAIGTGQPVLEGALVPYATDFPVKVADRQFAPPASHPYPTVSNCRTHAAFDGQPGIPIIGLPDCDRTLGDVGQPAVGALEGTPLDPGLTYDELKAAGIPIPENYSAPSYTGLQETFQVHLQAFRLGEVVLTVCPCEQWADQSRNIKSRADRVTGNLHLGWDWTDFCSAGPGSGEWTCPDSRAVARWDTDPTVPPENSTVVIDDATYRRMRAQVRNDAAGWDDLVNTLTAESEPADPSKILGNYTHTELAPEYGYELVVPISMSNDYWGYIATYREYQRGDHYRKALTGLGPHSSDFFASRLVAMAGSLKGDPASTAKIQYGPLDLLYMVDGLHQEARAMLLGHDAQAYVTAYDATLPPDKEPQMLVQPQSITRFDVATTQWRGSSNYNDLPYVFVEREVEPGVWVNAGDTHGEVVVTVDFPDSLVDGTATFRTGGLDWVWTAHWEAFDSDIDTARGSQTSAGTYRFRISGQYRVEGVPSTVTSYQLLSEPFTVSAWEGITATDLRQEPDGTVSFAVGPTNTKQFCTASYPDCGELVARTVGPIDYPDTWPEAKLPTAPPTGRTTFPRLERHIVASTQTYCFPCTFRPWADTGTVAAATVTYVDAFGRSRSVPATLGSDGRWRTSDVLPENETAVVERGAIVDTFGEFNGVASNVVTGVGGLGVAPLTQLPATGGSSVPVVPVVLLAIAVFAARGSIVRRARPTA